MSSRSDPPAPPEADEAFPDEGRRVTRESRKPFGSLLQKLAYPARHGYHRHWFNDDPGRIRDAGEAGYTHVKDEDGKIVVRTVGVAKEGGALKGYLMEIPQEWYDEDMAHAQDKAMDVDRAIQRGEVKSNSPLGAKDQEKFYPGAQGRKIQITRR
jgi:hypothetical protein